MKSPRAVAAVLFPVVLALGLAACQPAPPPKDPKACDVAVVGDSLTVGVEPHLARALSNRGCRLEWIDGRRNRRTSDGVEILKNRARLDQLPNVLVVGLGTNDRFQQGDFAGHVDTVMRLSNGRKVIWIELAYNPVKAHLNGVLRAKARQYGNLTVMDWDRPYWSNPAWRHADDVHCTEAGNEARSRLMVEAALRVTK